MIAMLEGRVVALHDDHVVLVVGGVGFKVFMPASTITRLTEGETLLYTSMVVREDSLSLYGFLTQTERDVFETITGVSGIGPRLGLSILGTLGVDHLRSAVIMEKADVLVRVPGIGKKMAQKLVLELKDKLGGDLESMPTGVFTDANQDVLDTLVALGYSIVEAQAAIQALPADAPDDVEARVRMALQYFV